MEKNIENKGNGIISTRHVIVRTLVQLIYIM